MIGAYRWLRWCGKGRPHAALHALYWSWRLGLNDPVTRADGTIETRGASPASLLRDMDCGS